MSHAKIIVYIALLTALSFSLFLLEGLLPVPFLAPGAKLGLANLVTVAAICTLPCWQYALTVLLVRILLSALLGGGPTILLYSLVGGLLSFAVMTGLRQTGRFSLIGISCAGGFAHHVGQLTVAALTLTTPDIFLYLPLLGPCGLLTGGVIGCVAERIIRKIPPYILPVSML